VKGSGGPVTRPGASESCENDGEGWRGDDAAPSLLLFNRSLSVASRPASGVSFDR